MPIAGVEQGHVAVAELPHALDRRSRADDGNGFVEDFERRDMGMVIEALGQQDQSHALGLLGSHGMASFKQPGLAVEGQGFDEPRVDQDALVGEIEEPAIGPVVGEVHGAIGGESVVLTIAIARFCRGGKP
jgi:hypothetical protein